HRKCIAASRRWPPPWPPRGSTTPSHKADAADQKSWPALLDIPACPASKDEHGGGRSNPARPTRPSLARRDADREPACRRCEEPDEAPPARRARPPAPSQSV